MPIVNEVEVLIRLTEPRYADDLSEIHGGVDAVTIAQVVFDQSGPMPSADGTSNLFVNWGQLIDHDLDLTRDASGEMLEVGLVAPFVRSVYDPASGQTGPREQLNEVTPEIDGSQVYGSTNDRTAALRSFEGGRLKMSEDATSEFGLLPINEDGLVMAGDRDPGNPLFLAGDVRANENTGLTVLHTVFNREHNYWADRISEANPDLTDEDVFQAARSVVEFEIQQITYRDWLPHLIGGATDAVDLPEMVDGRIATEFSTAAFRFGHSMVTSSLERLAEDGTSLGSLTVRGQFFNADALKLDGIAGVLRGQAGTTAQEMDTKVIDDLNFFLAAPDGTIGFSLAALNILRARDHGIDTYVNVRAALIGDIDPETLDADDFSIITADPVVQQELAAVYGSVFEVDLWVGGFAEDSIAGSKLGVTFTHIIADQFARTRAADETFGRLDPRIDQSLLAEIRGSSLSDIIQRVSEVEYLNRDVFHAAERVGGTRQNDTLVGGDQDEMLIGFEGDDDIRSSGGDDHVFAGFGANTVLAGAGDDYVSAYGDDDQVFGGAGDDTLYAGAGDDRVGGAAGADLSGGGAGDDVMWGGAGNDSLHGMSGDDTVFGGTGDDKIIAGSGDDEVFGGSGNDLIWAGSGNDTVFGNKDSDEISGGTGADMIYAGNGDDTVYGGTGNDTIGGGWGDDVLWTGVGDDVGYGWAGDDVLFGLGGDDVLWGGAGRDLLDGGAGNDTLRGGADADTLVFSAGADQVVDFGAGDLIDLSDVDVITDFADLQANHLSGAADAVIEDGSGNSMTLLGVGSAMLDADDFIF